MNTFYKIEERQAKMVKSLTKPGKDILKTLSSENMNLLHMAIGIAGEAGEIIDVIKKTAIYNKPLDIENIIEELGDIEFYLEGLRQGIKVDRRLTINNNINKLIKRYSNWEYSDKKAQERADKS